MPELPEVEVTRAGLTDRVDGARIAAARLGKPLRWPMGRDPQDLVGGRIGALQRRGKYLWMPIALEGAGQPAEHTPLAALAASPGSTASACPSASGGLLIHLGMSGSLGWHAQASPPGPHDHFDLLTDRGLLRLNDPRRFGAVVWSDAMGLDPARKLLSTLGPEPFDPALTPDGLRRLWRGRRAPIKAALLAGDAVVGVGNIYASEALHRAGIDPRTPCGRLGPVRCARLLTAVREVLSQAIALGGSTLRDFRDVHGMDGAFQQVAGVYGRAGAPCPRCGATVRRILQGQRATYWCAGCQKR